MTSAKNISIAGREIGDGCRPYIIAELSANHNGSLDRALELIDAAAKTGADAIKIQTYRADTITVKSDAEEFRIKGGLWDGRTLYDLYEEAHTPWEWHAELFARARTRGITMFSSPFDTTAVDFLQSLGAPAYKIASFEAVDLPLIRYVAKTGKPMIISTGMANEEEIAEAIDAAKQGGCAELAVLHCVSGYPAPAENYNLRTIPDMRARFGTIVGLSDHTIDNTTAVASISLGAAIIEKHFTLDRNGGGPDDSFSLEPDQFAALCRDAGTAFDALGTIDYTRKPSEIGNAIFRRSLYFVRDIAAGQIVTAEDVRSIRPGFGLPPKMLDQVIGRRATQDIRAPSAVRASLLQSKIADPSDK